MILHCQTHNLIILSFSISNSQLIKLHYLSYLITSQKIVLQQNLAQYIHVKTTSRI